MIHMVEPPRESKHRLLYLRDLSTGYFVPALGQFPWVVRRAVGGGDYPAHRAVAGRAAGVRGPGPGPVGRADYAYLWADVIHVSVRLEEHKLCLVVMIGVRADGRKEPSIAPRFSPISAR